MSFLSIATPFVALGIPVFPLTPKTKIPPSGFHFLEEATIDPAKVASWNDENPDYNVALLANGEFCFLEFDVAKGMSAAAAEMGQKIPLTRTQVSGKGFGHYIFRHTERSRALGNRSVNLPEGGEWFSFRAGNKYLVGAGSVHPNGRYYENARDIEPIPMPDWLCDFVEKHSTPSKPAVSDNAVQVADDFDFEDMVDFYGIGIIGEKDDVWQVVEECPGVGYRHSGSTLTAFYWDGSSLGWSCFAQGCPLNGKRIGEVIAFLNAQKGEPYTGPIWEHDDDAELAAKWRVEMLDSIDAEPVPAEEEFIFTVEEVPAVTPVDYTEGVEETIREQKEAGDLPFNTEDYAPAPHAVAIEDPDKAEGLEFPGDSCMYGRLAEITKSHERFQSQLGWLYPSHLTVASALDIEDADGNVRSNLYMALLGDVGDGKTVCMKAALASIPLPGENTLIKRSPGSHSGLLNLLDENEPKPFLLALNELKTVLDACAIQGSRLPQMLCTMWEEDEYGDSVKRGVSDGYGKLSIIGGLAVADSADFGRLFGTSSVTGMADRFLLGYSTASVAYKPTRISPRVINVKPVHIAEWVWDVKNEWVGEHRERRRMSEQVLRVALVTAAVNGDIEITPPCLEAAFRFCEWQLRLRQRFKPGMAETKEAECYEAVYNALKEAYDRQHKLRQMPKGADRITDPDLDMVDRWQLLNFRGIVNSKSYYRRYAGLIDRVRKSMADNGVIEEYREPEEDEKGRSLNPKPHLSYSVQECFEGVAQSFEVTALDCTKSKTDCTDGAKMDVQSKVSI